jgi:hypothetical protein
VRFAWIEEHRATWPVAVQCDEGDGPFPAGLDPPAQFGLSANVEPSTIAVKLLNQQVGRLARPQSAFGQQEIDGEAPVIDLSQKLKHCLLIKDVHGLRVIFLQLAVSQFKDGVLCARGQMPAPHGKLIERSTCVQNKPDASFPERTAA